MHGLWISGLVAVVAGALGAAGMRAAGALLARHAPARVPPAAPATTVQDPWLPPLHCCEQAVCRAARAVDSMSSTSARQGLRRVVRRMDAELPNIRALAELGRGLEPNAPGADDAARRVFEQLEDAANRFAMMTDHVLEVVVRQVAHPDLDRVHVEVTVLREQFPLLRPMSAVLGPGLLCLPA